MPPTRTSSFGVSRREAHDSSAFYERSLYQDSASQPAPAQAEEPPPADQAREIPEGIIYNQSSEAMPLPDACAGLAFTSPPYNAGKDFDADLSLEAYLDLVTRVGREVYRVLKPGGRYVINIANLGRKPYIPLHAYFYQRHMQIGFLPMGEIIWQKARGASGSCAWGSWRSARSPRLRDVHEYLLVFAKGGFSRSEPGESTISTEEFMAATLSVWNIAPESARRVGHPAPFPLELASRVIQLFSYAGDLVIDPFCGSGTTCLAARDLGRRYAGFDISAEYCALAAARLQAMEEDGKASPVT